MMSCRATLMMMMMMMKAEGHRPVVIVHGLFDGPKQFNKLVQFITEVNPDTEVSVIDLFNHQFSLEPMWKQVKAFNKALNILEEKSADGIHLLCFSQGGLICRALLSMSPNHNVHTFISLSSPLAGQYGDTEYLRKVIPVVVIKEIFHFCYSRFGQKISICDYWNDPHHREKYLKNNNFLPLLNGERQHEHMKEWRENFLRIKKLVLIGGPDDGVITPWESSFFGFYNNNDTVVEMRKQEVRRSPDHLDTFSL
uniref:palmitoyl-CoA hydrolase n=1 Tax=Gouania willdenowi TaxID=441366 RepID=A0A8C5DFN1_GOUWI